MLGGMLAVRIWARPGSATESAAPHYAGHHDLRGRAQRRLNQIFIFELGWGIAGSAWATSRQCSRLVLALALFANRAIDREVSLAPDWRPNAAELARLSASASRLACFQR